MFKQPFSPQKVTLSKHASGQEQRALQIKVEIPSTIQDVQTDREQTMKIVVKCKVPSTPSYK